MFEDTLSNAFKRMDGAILCAVIDEEGIPVASYPHESESSEASELVLQVLNELKQTINLIKENNFGNTEEILIKTDRYILLIKPLNANYFLVSVLKTDAISGKARYILKVIEDDIKSQL
jgi:predicted regulator of Ras-like GTPase activity (Roadblock/LC7/MglB family)